MSDFCQNGTVATFHRLRTDIEKLEESLYESCREQGVTLVLPSLFSEIRGPGLRRILSELVNINYLREIVLSLGPATHEQFLEMKRFLAVLPQKVTIIWNSGPRIQALYDELLESGLNPGPDGKGRNAWISYGYVLAERGSRVICLHDCDIVTYSRELLARLIYPVVSPELKYEFCKGYYGRITNRLNGRVTRLLVAPLIRSLQVVFGRIPILDYFASFRYPLAGEFAMQADLARVNRIPSDWGLEIGILAEVYRNTALSRICQSELCDNYDHKHQPLSPLDPGRGLNKMAVDITKALFRVLCGEGIALQPGFMTGLWANYRRISQDMITRYAGEAKINGLEYDRHEEEEAVDVFAGSIRMAEDAIASDPLGPKAVPNWARVFSALPGLDERLVEAIKLDNQEDMRVTEYAEEAGHI